MAKPTRSKAQGGSQDRSQDKSQGKSQGRSRRRSQGAGASAGTAADPVEVMMELVAAEGWRGLTLARIAEASGLRLGDLYLQHGSKNDLLAAYARRVDAAMLAALGDAAVASDDTDALRDRLFEAIMARLDALAPHKAAVRSLAESARRSPMFALGLNKLTVRSQQWMLAAAKIDVAGLSGAVRAQGLAVVFAKVLRVWLRDEDPGLARTMAALDRELDKGERALGLLHNVCRLATCGGRRRRTRQETGPEPDAPLAA